MKLSHIKINRFRNIDTFSSDIGDGIVLFKGRNETGKSSLLSAIIFGIFEDPKSTAQRLKEARRWNNETLYSISVQFSANGDSYVLEKDFENETVLLKNKTTDESWKDKNKVNAKLMGIIGFFSKDIFTSTACVFQDELHMIRSGQRDLRSLLEEKVAGKEDLTVDPILRLLEKKVLDLKRGLDRSAPVNPGQIKKATDEISDLKQRRDEIADKVARLHEARQRVHEISDDLEGAQKSLEIKKQALEKSRLYVKEKDKHEKSAMDLGKTMENLEKLIKAEQQIEGLTAQHEVKRENLKDSEINLEKCKAVSKIKTEKEALEKDMRKKREILKKAHQIVSASEELKKSLPELPVVSDKLIRDVTQTESDIKALEKGTGTRAMSLTVNFKTRIPYMIESEDGVISRGDGVAGETVEGTAKKEIKIDLKDVAEVQVTTKDQALEEGIAELREKKKALKGQLERHRCRTVTELAAMKEKRDKIERELEAKGREFKIIIGKDTVESLAAVVSESEKRLNQRKKDLEDLKAFAVSDEKIAERARETQTLQKEVQELEGNIRENQGILKSFNKEKLENEKKDLAREILVAETALEDLKGFESTGEEVIRKEHEVRNLEEKLSNLKIEQKSLEHTLQEDRYGQEDVAELEERIESLDKRVGRLKTRLRAYEIIGEVLIEARQNILNNISREVDTQIGKNFSLITGGKYDQVRLSRADFSLQVFSREKGDWIDPDTAGLSVGARDQLYLAARLALLDSITGGNSIPLILDDPLIHFDSLRRENTRKLLKEVSKKHQILIFSCHDHYDEWADQIINF